MLSVEERARNREAIMNAHNPMKFPETWIPIYSSNPSKLTLHIFKNGVWKPTVYCKCVPWPEKFTVNT